MIYRTIRVILKNSIKLLSILHEGWLRLPANMKTGKNYEIVTLEKSNSKLIKNLNGKIEYLYIPKVYRFSLGGVITHNSNSRQLWKCSKASFVNRSNFIRFCDGYTFNPKCENMMSFFSILGDADIISYKINKIKLTSTSKKIKFSEVFHINGVNFNNWAHFLAEYFPKLSFIKEAAKECSDLKIVLFDGVDRHIVEMIKNFINDYSNVKLIIVPPDMEVFAEKLYYIISDTHISDLAKISTQYHIKMSDHTAKFLLDIGRSNSKNNEKKDEINIFIGRKGKRGISNYNEVLNLFKKYNFIEVFPHLLDLEEKIELFSRAKYVAGPLSSGFANVIFGQTIKEVLILTNCSRHDDMYLTKIAKFKKINLEYYLGNQSDPFLEDSNFSINMDDIAECLNDKWGTTS